MMHSYSIPLAPPRRITLHCLSMIRLRRTPTAFLCAFIFLTSLRADEIKTIQISGTTLYYHYLKSDSAHGLVFFLHGSAEAFKGKALNAPVETVVLTEGNEEFISVWKNQGYDVIMPICYNEFNWLEPRGKFFVDTLTKMYSVAYSSIYLTGFSDGGTGAYRYFYNNMDAYDGVIIFNGYPQLNNFNNTVDYKNCTSKKVLFVSQKSDKVVPYEFLLVEYRRQKMVNEQTYFWLREGKHQFVKYTKADFENCIALLERPTSARTEDRVSTWVYPPLDGFLVGDSLREMYTFRAKIGKGYGMKKSEYISAPESSKNLKNKNAVIYPCKVVKANLGKEWLQFPAIVDGQVTSLRIFNYLAIKAW